MKIIILLLIILKNYVNPRESAVKNYLFVQAYHYAGWIPAKSAASCGKETFERYARRDPETGVTITSPSVTVGGVRLDMGVWLPFEEERGGDYEVLLPIRGEDGTCLSAVYALNPSDAVRGVLPYTVKNFYEQAFRYLGVLYGWGGKDGGVDCSGFVCSVMRTFGFKLPRNTSEQRVWAGKTTDLSGLGAEARISALSASRFPTAIYKKGHVMFFLGVEEGVFRSGGRLSHYAEPETLPEAAAAASALIEKLASRESGTRGQDIFDTLLALIHEYYREANV